VEECTCHLAHCAWIHLIQTTLLSVQGHIPLLRLLYSFITPAGYSILRTTLSEVAFTETVNVLLWSASIYIAIFQTLSLVVRRPVLKRLSEAALSLGSALIFMLFYAYLDLRIVVTTAFSQGKIDAAAMADGLRLRSYLASFDTFYPFATTPVCAFWLCFLLILCSCLHGYAPFRLNSDSPKRSNYPMLQRRL